jgi:epoxide hydrolase-like predicted phosphatase
MKFLVALLLILHSFCVGLEGPMVECKVIIFDFGGVVGGTDKIAVTKALSPLLDIPPQEAERLMQEVATAGEKGKTRGQVWVDYEKKTGKILPDDWDDYFENMKLVAIRPNLQMLELVKKLKKHGYRVAMLSNVSSQRARYIKKLGVYSYFDPVILSCETDVKKPEPRAFEILLSQLKVAPQECIFIDNGEGNLEIARNLGFDTISFSNIEQLEKELVHRGVVFS